MSSDLLKEFGVVEISGAGSGSRFTPHEIIGEEDEEFGDFEGLGTSAVINTNTLLQQKYSTAPAEEVSTSQYKPSENVKESPSSAFLSKANIENNDDDFGHFAANSVLFDADQAITNETTFPIQGQDPPRTTRSTGASTVLIETQKPIATSVQGPPEHSSNWDDYSQEEIWEPMETDQAPITFGNTISPISIDTEITAPPKQIKEASRTISAPPPSNIPPPSVLLPLVARNFESLSVDTKNAGPAAHYPPSESPRIVNRSRTDQIHAVIGFARAGARVLAGRKLRWKRDSLLSQSMKIGPAGGKVSGMKLAGIDKSESRREDQEAMEALNAWRKQVGLLRSTVAMINNQSPQTGLKLPEISENMPIRSMKASEGAVTAPKACFLCGIKRDERVAKVDVDVEDSFGEWWCENWGHVDCVEFWETQKNSLPQR